MCAAGLADGAGSLARGQRLREVHALRAVSDGGDVICSMGGQRPGDRDGGKAEHWRRVRAHSDIVLAH